MSWLLPPLEPHFDAALRDVNAEGVSARIAAAHRLARPDASRLSEALDALRALLHDRVPAVRAAALDALSAVATEEDLEQAARLLEDSDPLVRELAVIAIGSIDHPDREGLLQAALHHRAPEVRFQALQACSHLCPESISIEALSLSRDDDARVREAAVRALSVPVLEPGPVYARLLALLNDADPGVRWEAAMALATDQEGAALPELLASLSVSKRILDTLDALATYRCGQAVSAVERIATSLFAPTIVIAAAGRALIRMGHRETGVAALRRVLSAFRTDGRNHALETVRAEHLTELGTELQRLARWPRGTDREQLRGALEAIATGSPPAATALRRWRRP